MAHSSRGLGHLPLKEEITGSNPVCATKVVTGEEIDFLFVLGLYFAHLLMLKVFFGLYGDWLADIVLISA